jgi:hypothetical protein
MLLLGRVVDVIMTACCLHNLIIQVGNEDEEESFEEKESENNEDEAVFLDAIEGDLGNAATKRKINVMKYILQ